MRLRAARMLMPAAAVVVLMSAQHVGGQEEAVHPSAALPAPPTGSLHARDGGLQTEAPVEVPLRVASGRLLVPVDAGVGHAVDFLLGTGSAVTVLTETAAAHLGDDPRLTLGGLPVPMTGFATVPDDQLAVEGALVAGMIGANMLNRFDVLVDAPGERLVLKSPAREVFWDGIALSDPVRVRVFHGIVMSFDVELDGERYPATLDLSTPTLVVNGGVQDDLALADNDVAELGLGGARQPDLAVRVLDLPLLRRFDPADEGFVLVGAPVAHDCALSLSWLHQEIRTCVR